MKFQLFQPKQGKPMAFQLLQPISKKAHFPAFPAGRGAWNYRPMKRQTAQGRLADHPGDK